MSYHVLAPLIDATSTLNLLNHADYERIHKYPPRVAPNIANRLPEGSRTAYKSAARPFRGAGRQVRKVASRCVPLHHRPNAILHGM